LRQALAQKEAELRRRLEAIEEERRAILEEARAQAQEEVETLRRQLKALERRWLYEGRSREDVEALRQDRERVDILAQQVSGEPPARSVDKEAEHEAEESRELAPGARVYLPRFQQEGVVLQVGDHDVEVQMGPLRLRVSPQELRVLASPSRREGPEGKPRVEVATPTRAPSPGPECHLRGMTVEEALEKLERYLEQAYLAGLPWVRIVHGKGTGRLREAVRRFLREHPVVIRFRPGDPAEGGEGVTIAWLDTQGSGDL